MNEPPEEKESAYPPEKDEGDNKEDRETPGNTGSQDDVLSQ